MDLTDIAVLSLVYIHCQRMCESAVCVFPFNTCMCFPSRGSQDLFCKSGGVRAPQEIREI